jgi:hypothetical protein
VHASVMGPYRKLALSFRQGCDAGTQNVTSVQWVPFWESPHRKHEVLTSSALETELNTATEILVSFSRLQSSSKPT